MVFELSEETSGRFAIREVLDGGETVDCGLEGPVEIAVAFERGQDMVQVQGVLRANLQVICSRCLAEMLYPMEAEFCETFRKGAEAFGEEYPFDGERLLLDQLARDVILMNLPGQFLCREDCKGLCPQCGRNRNEGDCGCKGNERENPFSKLKGLFDSNEEVEIHGGT